jgi:dipicolinate synthase subunit A
MTTGSALRVAIVGGDARSATIASLAAAEGADVRVLGAPVFEGPSVQVVDSLAEAVTAASIVVLPTPGRGHDGALYAPNAATPIHLDSPTLSLAAPRALVVAGHFPPELRQLVTEAGLVPRDLDDPVRKRIGAVATAEGALRIAIGMSDFTVMNSHAVVTGYGLIGSTVATLLRAVGARVTVVARRATQRTDAWATGCQTADPAAIGDVLAGADLLFQTTPGVPEAMVSRAVLRTARPTLCIIELASPPAGTDLAACAELGLRHVWARGQAALAPEPVGRSEWAAIRRIHEEEANRA